MSLGKGQSYRANSFDLGFINITPVDVVLMIANIDYGTNELELSFVPAGVRESETVAIARWFKESYPSRSKENCMLKNARAFERFIDLKYAVPEPHAGVVEVSPLTHSGYAAS